MATKAAKQTKLAEHLVTARIAAGLSQDQLGDRIGSNQSTLSGWERDETCPDVEMIDRLATALGIPRDTLIDAAIDYSKRFRAGKTADRRGRTRR